MVDSVELFPKRHKLQISHGVPSVAVIHVEAVEGCNNSLHVDENFQVHFLNGLAGGTFVFADEAALANFPNHNLGHVIHKVAGHGFQAAELLHDAVRQHGVHGIVQTPTCLLGLISSELVYSASLLSAVLLPSSSDSKSLDWEGPPP